METPREFLERVLLSFPRRRESMVTRKRQMDPRLRGDDGLAWGEHINNWSLRGAYCARQNLAVPI